MIDHVGLNVRDLEASRRFYTMVLSALNIEPLMQFESATGFGRDGKPFFWITRRDPVGGSTHVAFTCEDRQSVDIFHGAGVAAGGTDNGPPGIRGHYHPTYYAAFVLDPDGNNLEAVCHT